MNDTGAQVASGHPETTQAACDILEAGGNAVDALVAAAWTACVVEPIFCSPGGGGHAMIRMPGRAPVIADFFAQTPRRRRMDELEFYPIHGNFGTDVQEFHVGMGAVATPGMVAGLFELQQRCGTLPMTALVEPAVHVARTGCALTETQAFALQILEPIVRATPEASAMFGLPAQDAPLPEPGTVVRNRELGDWIEQVAADGPDALHHGEQAVAIAEDAHTHGGHLTLADLAGYRVHWRRPMRWTLGDATVWSNPPPAFGGLMVALMTQALEHRLPPGMAFGDDAHLAALTEAMTLSEQKREQLEHPDMLDCSRRLMQTFRQLEGELRVSRGTTHIGVRDAQGGFAGMTASNGEGCGRVVPGTGFMLNNMLGEEDLNRPGFHNWPLNRRLASMMAPTLVLRGGRRILLGSGGSNRIRTAIAQVLANLMHFDLDLSEAIRAPRLHVEGRRMAIEHPHPAWPASVDRWLSTHATDARRWPEPNLYFGGVHAVADDEAAADPRRGGVARTITP
jgi:gamma-glutamyltranspeptidase/glutathione hydrolase